MSTQPNSAQPSRVANVNETGCKTVSKTREKDSLNLINCFPAIVLLAAGKEAGDQVVSTISQFEICCTNRLFTGGLILLATRGVCS